MKYKQLIQGKLEQIHNILTIIHSHTSATSPTWQKDIRDAVARAKQLDEEIIELLNKEN